MPEEKQRPLRVFLSYASQDKLAVRELYERLKAEGWIDPWLDEEKLTLGQYWTSVIEDALDVADVVLIFLSKNSVQKEGFIQRELNYAWEISLEKPRSVIFLIPFRLDDCEVPRYLRSRQWGDYFGENKESTYQTLLRSLRERHRQKLRLEAEERARTEELARKHVEEAIHLEKVKKEREEAEKAAREKVEREAAEKIAREKAEKEVAEKAARKKEEKEATEKAAREKAEKEAAEKVTKEEVEPLSSDQKIAGVLGRINSRFVLGIFGLVVIFLAGIFGFPYLDDIFSIQPDATATATWTARPLNATEAAFISKVAPTQAPQTATVSVLLTNVAIGATQIAAETQSSVPTPTPSSIMNQDWREYVEKNQGSTISVQSKPETNDAMYISFNMLQGDWVSTYKKLPQKFLVGTNGLTVTYKGNGASNTIEVKLILNDETVCKKVTQSKTDTNDLTTDLEVSYSELECVTAAGGGAELNLENVDRLDFSFSNWPGDEAGEGEVFIELIQFNR